MTPTTPPFGGVAPCPGGFRPGAWVASLANLDTPRIAQVRDCYELDGELLLDLVIYRRDGTRVGRESPACGGPRTFEPACPASGWGLIESPNWDFLSAPRITWGDRVRWIKATP